MYCLAVDEIGVRRPGIAASAALHIEFGASPTRFSPSFFGLQGRQRFAVRVEDVSSTFVSGTIMGTSYAYGLGSGHAGMLNSNITIKS